MIFFTFLGIALANSQFVMSSQKLWENELHVIEHSPSDVEFRTLVSPIASLVNQTYTATTGCTYYDPNHDTYLPEGWSRGNLTHDPPDGGMRALTFLHEDGLRGVLAFRGTDLNDTSASGQADACADQILWGNSQDPLPDYCANFSADTLDYWSRARDFWQDVQEAYPSKQWLFSGHSLGAGLSVLLSMEQCCLSRVFPSGQAPSCENPTLVFSSPPVDQLLSERVPNCSLPALKAWHWRSALVLADSSDPVYYDAAVEEKGLNGTTDCIWVADPFPDSCQICFSGNTTDGDSAACSACFLASHSYSHYLDLVAESPRPACALTFRGSPRVVMSPKK